MQSSSLSRAVGPAVQPNNAASASKPACIEDVWGRIHFSEDVGFNLGMLSKTTFPLRTEQEKFFSPLEDRYLGDFTTLKQVVRRCLPSYIGDGDQAKRDMLCSAILCIWSFLEKNNGDFNLLILQIQARDLDVSPEIRAIQYCFGRENNVGFLSNKYSSSNSGCFIMYYLCHLVACNSCDGRWYSSQRFDTIATKGFIDMKYPSFSEKPFEVLYRIDNAIMKYLSGPYGTGAQYFNSGFAWNRPVVPLFEQSIPIVGRLASPSAETHQTQPYFLFLKIVCSIHSYLDGRNINLEQDCQTGRDDFSLQLNTFIEDNAQPKGLFSDIMPNDVTKFSLDSRLITYVISYIIYLFYGANSCYKDLSKPSHNDRAASIQKKMQEVIRRIAAKFYSQDAAKKLESKLSSFKGSNDLLCMFSNFGYIKFMKGQVNFRNALSGVAAHALAQPAVVPSEPVEVFAKPVEVSAVFDAVVDGNESSN
ncbi:MAG: hypothetical protein V4591_08170 [Bdellovibrionota bacterium]